MHTAAFTHVRIYGAQLTMDDPEGKSVLPCVSIPLRYFIVLYCAHRRARICYPDVRDTFCWSRHCKIYVMRLMLERINVALPTCGDSKSSYSTLLPEHQVSV